jgi:hypothetical protein
MSEPLGYCSQLKGWDGRILPGVEQYEPNTIEEVCKIVKEAGEGEKIMVVSTRHLIRDYPYKYDNEDIAILLSLANLKEIKMVTSESNPLEEELYIQPGITFTDAIKFLDSQDPPLELYQLVNTPKVSVIGSCSTASHGISLNTDTEGGCIASYITRVWYIDGNGHLNCVNDSDERMEIFRGTYGTVPIVAVTVRVRKRTWVRATVVKEPISEDFFTVTEDKTKLSEYVRSKVGEGGLSIGIDPRPKCNSCYCHCCWNIPCLTTPTNQLSIHTLTHVEEPENLLRCCGGLPNTSEGARADCGERCGMCVLSPLAKLINAGCTWLLCINRCRDPQPSSDRVEPWSLNLTYSMSDRSQFFKISDAEVLVPIEKLDEVFDVVCDEMKITYSFHEYQVYARYTKPSSGVAIYQNPVDPDWIWVGFRVLRSDAKQHINNIVSRLKEDYGARVHGAKLGDTNSSISSPTGLEDLETEVGKNRFVRLHKPEAVTME